MHSCNQIKRSGNKVLLNIEGICSYHHGLVQCFHQCYLKFQKENPDIPQARDPIISKVTGVVTVVTTACACMSWVIGWICIDGGDTDWGEYVVFQLLTHF